MEAYFKHPNDTFYTNLFLVVKITFGVLIVTYVLLLVARALTDLYDKIALPWLSKLTDKSSVVLRSQFNELEEVVKQLETRLEQERLAKVAVQNERDKADAKIIELINKDRNVGQPTVPATNLPNESPVPNNFIRISNRLINDKKVSQFNNLVPAILNHDWIRVNDELIKYLLKENLIIGTGEKTNDHEWQYYGFTQEGLAFLKYWNDLDHQVSLYDVAQSAV